ncbi:hypothetical protein Tco_1367247 [Tanacetum coccineum]
MLLFYELTPKLLVPLHNEFGGVKIILTDSEAKGAASNTVVLDFAQVSDTDSELSEVPPSLDHAPALDDDTKLLEAPPSPDFTLGSYSDTKPFDEDPQEADPEESFEEDPSEEDSSDENLMEADDPL